MSFQNRENRGLTAEQRQELNKTAVRDKSGRPERVYHYTANTEFTQFGESGDVGFHFGNLRQASGRRADLKQSRGRIIRGYLNIKNPVNIGNDMMGYKPGVLAMKLNVLGILDESEKSTIFDMALKDDGSYNSRSARALRALLEKKGYDGIVYNNLYEGEGRSYIAFYPQQVICAEENYNNIARTMQAVEEFAAGKGLKVEYFSDGDRRAPEGYINGDTVYINMASDAPIVGVAVHEVGHRLKDGNTKRWNRYARSVSRLMSTNRELAGYAEQVRDSYTDPDSARYSSVLDENGNIDRAKVDEEVILKVTQEILKRTADGDTDFLQQIAADRSLIDRLLDFIRGIKNSITIKLTGSEMAMLDEAERNLVNLMRGESKGLNISDVKFDLLNGIGSKKCILIEQIEKARNGELFEETHLVVSNKTPKFYEIFGLNTELPLLITKKHALDITTAEDGIHDNYHGITDSQLKSAIKSMAEPALVFESATHPGRLVVVTTVVDDKRRPIIMAIKPNARGNINTLECDTNLIASLYGKDNFIKFFIKNITNDNLLYHNKEKSRLLSNTPGVQFPNNIPHVDFNKNIQKFKQKVNGKKQSDSGKKDVGVGEKNTRYSLDIRQRILQQTAKADNIKNRAVSDFTRQVRDIFGIDSSVSADIKTAVQDMATEVLDNGYVSPAAANRLFDKAVQLGSEIDENYRRYDELRKRINRTGIEPVGGAEYRDFLAKYRGKVKFKRGGIPVDMLYQKLTAEYPEYIDGDISNPEALQAKRCKVIWKSSQT